MSNVTKLKIEGMSCGHCVVAVTKALQGVDGVEKAEVDLAAGRATVHHSRGAAAEQLIAAVEEEGYGAQAA